jgi:hypothetical protein
MKISCLLPVVCCQKRDESEGRGTREMKISCRLAVVCCQKRGESEGRGTRGNENQSPVGGCLLSGKGRERRTGDEGDTRIKMQEPRIKKGLYLQVPISAQ